MRRRARRGPDASTLSPWPPRRAPRRAPPAGRRRPPCREAAVRSVEASVRSGRGRPDERADQLEVAEACGDAQVAGSRRAPATSRWPQKSAATSGVPPSPRAESSVRAPAASISVARSEPSSSRPGAASSSRSRYRGSGRRRARAGATRSRVAGDPQQVVAVRPACTRSSGNRSRSSSSCAVLRLDARYASTNGVGGSAPLHRLDVAAKPGPAREAVAAREVAARPRRR